MIKLEKVDKIYKVGAEDVHALRRFDFTIDKGEYIAIMGPSGSGKSTLLNILGLLDVPTNGVYLFNNEDVTVMSDARLAEFRNKRVGFIFQTFNLLPRTNALHNVELPLIYGKKSPAARKGIALEALEAVGLGDRWKHKPNELSGGQRQRVAIARAIVNEPEIILADEPTGNLDSKTGAEIMDIIDNIHRKGNTIILVTHEDYIADHADRIIHLLDGQIESDKRRE
ncbi:ABC transporter ATP-binding protein [bacterium]|nr:ABC transporter ATP-binding protein [bacterium]